MATGHVHAAQADLLGIAPHGCERGLCLAGPSQAMRAAQAVSIAEQPDLTSASPCILPSHVMPAAGFKLANMCMCMQPEEHKALEEFGARFSGVRFYKGMPLAFTTSGGGKLTTRIDELEVGAAGSWHIEAVSPENCFRGRLLQPAIYGESLI